MKQKDILIIIAVAIFGIILALVLSNFLFVKSDTKSQEIEKMDSISTEFNSESVKKYVNEKAVNPSQLIEIEQSDNKDPLQ